ncbi:MAG: hypothetical protein CSB47_03610 [Proteobacteria bacterium]|nr:MAG: hypothetical protein CSB47_03610 [Pseudomonadota bacterium]
MNRGRFTFESEEFVPTTTLAAAFAIALVLGSVVITGGVFKPYEARQVVGKLYERILYEKEMRELRRLSYDTNAVTHKPLLVSVATERSEGVESSSAVMPVTPESNVKKTERAKNFEQAIRSDTYWAGLQKSIHRDVVGPDPQSVAIPVIVIGSTD